jgi:hypothetical protein
MIIYMLKDIVIICIILLVLYYIDLKFLKVFNNEPNIEKLSLTNPTVNPFELMPSIDTNVDSYRMRGKNVDQC